MKINKLTLCLFKIVERRGIEINTLASVYKNRGQSCVPNMTFNAGWTAVPTQVA